MCGWSFACGVGSIERREWVTTSSWPLVRSLLALPLRNSENGSRSTDGVTNMEGDYVGSIRTELRVIPRVLRPHLVFLAPVI